MSADYPWAEAARKAIPRFLAKVQPNGQLPAHAPWLGECWIWCGGRSRGGSNDRKVHLLYGSFRCGGQGRRAHIFVCVVEGRMIPGYHVDHLCKNTLCVRSSHIEVVPPEVNQERRWEGRRRTDLRLVA